MHNPNRQKEFMELMQGSIAPLPEAPQFVPMQPMEVAPMEHQPSPVAPIAAMGANLLNRKRRQSDADAEDYE